VNVTIAFVAINDSSSAHQVCPACGTAIDTTGADPLARVACPKCGEKVRVERAFDQFFLLETLGIGGMGTVYKARDTRLDRLVALKLLRKDLEGGVNQAVQLQQEARVAASVNHPNVVQVFSSGTDHEQFYLVMELVDHGSLDDFIEQQKRLPEEQVLEAGIQVAKGLRAAHRKGLIHRDVKPANILFSDEHTAKISDFGLAGVAAQEAETRGEVWGTPYYVAPERLKNEPEDLRSDIYSLGATLFHAVAGRAPIAGETNSAVVLRDLKEHPLDLRAVAPDVSPAMARVLNRMIAPEPAHRFSSYDELVAELEKAYNILTGREDVDPAVRRRKTLALIGATALILAAIATVIVVFVRKHERTSATTAASAQLREMVAVAKLEYEAADARHELLINHHKVAGAAFAKIAMDARVKQPLYDWARLQQGLAAMVGRETSQARQAFQDVENSGQLGFAKEDTDLATFFIATAKTLLAAGIVPASQGVKSTNTYSIFALLLFALKDIEQSDTEAAAPLLERFVAAQPEEKYAWIADYKPLAQKYLDDCRLYATWKRQPKDKGSGRDLTATLADLRDLRKKIKMRTAMSEELASEEKSLAARLSDREKKGNASRPRQRKEAVNVEMPGWNAAMASYRKQVPLYNFAAANAAVKSPRLTEPSLKQSQDGTKKKAQWLVDWKGKLIADINRAQFAGPIADVSGVQYQGISNATADQLALKTPYGTVGVPWTKLAPKTLLAISSSFVQPSAPDAADRQWLSAVFAAETGQAESARQLAEAAAKTKPDYRGQISLLLPPASASH
jgi:eukaryotic-like serine/threonine-protein kinase